VTASSWALPAAHLHSSVADLLRYLAANLGLLQTKLSPAIQRSHQVLAAAPAAGTAGTQTMAYNWFVGYNGSQMNVLSHDGLMEGFQSDLGFDPKAQVGHVVLTNGAQFDANDDSPFYTAIESFYDLIY